MICKWHLCEVELTGRQTVFCSINCKNKFHVNKRRKGLKQQLVDHFGGQCQMCGYFKSVVALQFHHPDDNKEFGLAAKGHTMSWEKALAEASKCVLICANCHAEEHERLRLASFV